MRFSEKSIYIFLLPRTRFGNGFTPSPPTKKTYISRLENGKADIQLSTLFRIFEGLGRRVSLTIL